MTASPDFESLIAVPDGELDLARAALAIAADAAPGLDVEANVARLDAMGEAVRGACAGRPTPVQGLAALDRQLFSIERFRGNTDDYYDPRNSYLNEVLERRTGIPITLSIVYLETAWRAGLDLVPVAFPGHFLVATSGGEHEFIDPFNAGRRLRRQDLLARLVSMLGSAARAAAYLPRAVRAAPRREVIARVLRNLKAIHMRRGDLHALLGVYNRLLALDLADAAAVRDRAHVLARLECHRAAYEDYQHYLRLAPLADDAEAIRARIEQLRPLATRMN